MDTLNEKEIEKNCFYLVRHTDLNDGSFLGIGRNPGVASLMNKKILNILKSTSIKLFLVLQCENRNSRANYKKIQII